MARSLPPPPAPLCTVKGMGGTLFADWSATTWGPGAASSSEVGRVGATRGQAIRVKSRPGRAVRLIDLPPPGERLPAATATGARGSHRAVGKGPGQREEAWSPKGPRTVTVVGLCHQAAAFAACERSLPLPGLGMAMAAGTPRGSIAVASAAYSSLACRRAAYCVLRAA